MIEVINKKDNGMAVIRLSNEQLTVEVTNLGCTILKLETKDKNGQIQDVVLGYDQLEDYLNYDGYLGGIVGRCANRIKHGKFTLNGKEYTLAVNNGPNSLHGGIQCFTYKVFDYKIEDEQLIFSYLSKDMEEGYPGNLHLFAKYKLQEDSLVITYEAICDQDTIINITNHSYFNLDGKPSKIDNHELMIHAAVVAKIDADVLATGEFMHVENTPFDFRKPTLLKDNLYQEHEQLQMGKGIDHPFVFTTTQNQVVLYSKETGLELTVSSTLPQAQIYTANFMDGRLGKQGLEMPEKCAICIETQRMPNDINFNANSLTILRKGNRYEEKTSYRIRVRG